MNTKTLALPKALLLCILVFSVAQNLAASSVTPAPDSPTKVQVIAHSVKYEEVTDTLNYPAIVLALNATEVSTEIEGKVTKVHVVLGQQVSKGTKLVTIENSDPIYHYAPSNLLSPEMGVVSEIDASPGARVSRGKVLVRITDSRKTKARIEVTAADVQKLKLGASAEFKSENQSYRVIVSSISPIIDTARGTAPVEFDIIANPPPISGTIGNLSLKVNKRIANLVPERAVYYRGKDPYVIVLDKDNTASFTNVKISKKSSEFMEIESTLKEGDSIVMRATGFIAEGDQVIVQKPEVSAK